MKYLLEHGVAKKDVIAQNYQNKTALLLASENNHLKIVKYLFKKSAEKQDANLKRDWNSIIWIDPHSCQTALVLASTIGYLKIVKY